MMMQKLYVIDSDDFHYRLYNSSKTETICNIPINTISLSAAGYYKISRLIAELKKYLLLDLMCIKILKAYGDIQSSK
jgi:hypothetical protein